MCVVVGGYREGAEGEAGQGRGMCVGGYREGAEGEAGQDRGMWMCVGGV